MFKTSIYCSLSTVCLLGYFSIIIIHSLAITDGAPIAVYSLDGRNQSDPAENARLFPCTTTQMMKRTTKLYRGASRTMKDVFPGDVGQRISRKTTTKILLKLIQNQPCNQRADSALQNALKDFYETKLHTTKLALQELEQNSHRQPNYQLLKSMFTRLQRNKDFGLVELVNAFSQPMHGGDSETITLQSAATTANDTSPSCLTSSSSRTWTLEHCLRQVIQRDTADLEAVVKGVNRHDKKCGMPSLVTPCTEWMHTRTVAFDPTSVSLFALATVLPIALTAAIVVVCICFTRKCSSRRRSHQFENPLVVTAAINGSETSPSNELPPPSMVSPTCPQSPIYSASQPFLQAAAVPERTVELDVPHACS